MATPNPNLYFFGDAEEAFNFYKSVFGGEFKSFMRFGDMPGGDKMSAEDRPKVAHVELPIGNNNVLMGNDVPSFLGKIEAGRGFAIELECESKEEAKTLYYALAEGGEEDPHMPLGDAFWGSYYGQLTDKFGVRWMVNYTYPKK